jgi:hypothetical protein
MSSLCRYPNGALVGIKFPLVLLSLWAFRLGWGGTRDGESDTAKAKVAYQDFLTLWKDADPDIPILIAAKAEYPSVRLLCLGG